MVYVHSLSDEEKRKLKQMTRQQVGRVAERARMILLSGKGYTIQQIAETLECSDKTVRNWLSGYESEGCDGLLDKPRAGRPAILDEKPHAVRPVVLGRRVHGMDAMDHAVVLDDLNPVDFVPCFHLKAKRPLLRGRDLASHRGAVQRNSEANAIAGQSVGPPHPQGLEDGLADVLAHLADVDIEGCHDVDVEGAIATDIPVDQPSGVPGASPPVVLDALDQ